MARICNHLTRPVPLLFSPRGRKALIFKPEAFVFEPEAFILMSGLKLGFAQKSRHESSEQSVVLSKMLWIERKACHFSSPFLHVMIVTFAQAPIQSVTPEARSGATKSWNLTIRQPATGTHRESGQTTRPEPGQHSHVPRYRA